MIKTLSRTFGGEKVTMELIKYLSPFFLFRSYVRTPVEAFVHQQYIGYKKRTNEGINSVKELLYRAGIVAVFVTAILWVSMFMYVFFYYTYMPNVTHVRPVHLQFKGVPMEGFERDADESQPRMFNPSLVNDVKNVHLSCEEQAGLCSFPSAHVQLTKRSQMLMSTQPYRIRLMLDMPESQINKELGMFMVCAQMRAKGGVLVSSSCRSAMLRHRSYLHHVLRTLTLAPLLLAGVNEEKQQVQVELFSDFEDDQNLPVTDAYVEVQSRFAQVYSCELQIEAHFTGLRYIMYHWPKVSAAIGISTNLFFVSLIFILSWYQLQQGIPTFMKTYFGIVIKPEIEAEDFDKKIFGMKMKLDRDDSSMYFEDESILEELEKQKKT